MKEFLCITAKKLHNLPPMLTNIHCKSLVDKYKERHHSLEKKLAKFIASYDSKTSKECGHDKIISWVSFNFHKDPKNHYKKLLFCSIIFANQKLI
jgi:hypothetical protein